MERRKILFAASEMSPFAKTGGLADVIGSLPPELSDRYEISVVLPLYSTIDRKGYGIRRNGESFMVPVSKREEMADVWTTEAADGRVRVYFIWNHFFERDGLYGNAGGDFPDNSERFVFFSRAVLELARREINPDIIHCNDWQTALVPLYLKEVYHPEGDLMNVKTVLTIHNLGYQGRFWSYDLHILNLGWEIFTPEKLEFYNDLNFLKGGIVYADRLTTVSRRYAEEIKTEEFGHGLEGVLLHHADKLTGIVNGVDTSIWNPETDTMLPFNYSKNDLSGKKMNRLALLEHAGLDEKSIPIFGIVSRLSAQKGFDILPDALRPFLEKGEINLVLLGNGEKRFMRMMRELEQEFPDNVSLFIRFDEEMAHLIEAGADFFLMPSHYEPCGLNQMYSMLYGTLPIVRKTGGLDDTVVDQSEDGSAPTGFKFEDYTSDALSEKITQAVDLFHSEGELYGRMVKNAMDQDFSWHHASISYSKLYDHLIKESL